MSGRIETAQYDGLSLTLPDVKGAVRKLKPKRPNFWAVFWSVMVVWNVLGFVVGEGAIRLVSLTSAVGAAFLARSSYRNPTRGMMGLDRDWQIGFVLVTAAFLAGIVINNA